MYIPGLYHTYTKIPKVVHGGCFPDAWGGEAEPEKHCGTGRKLVERRPLMRELVQEEVISEVGVSAARVLPKARSQTASKTAGVTSWTDCLNSFERKRWKDSSSLE